MYEESILSSRLTSIITDFCEDTDFRLIKFLDTGKLSDVPAYNYTLLEMLPLAADNLNEPDTKNE